MSGNSVSKAARQADTRDLLAVRDITGPQFRIEEPMTRRTNPLLPVYQYDSGAVEPVAVRVPKQSLSTAASTFADMCVHGTCVHGSPWSARASEALWSTHEIAIFACEMHDEL